MKDPADLLADVVEGVVGMGPVALHEPTFGISEREYVQDCLDTAMVSSVGPYVQRFEERLAELTGARHVVATNTGTSALQLSLLSVGVQPGDEVVVPSLSFVATANAVSYLGAVPHFADVSQRTLGLDPVSLRSWIENTAELTDAGLVNRETGRTIRAVVPMHTFGHPVDMDPLLELASAFQLQVVEDAAESLGSYYKGRHTGTIGRAGALSFNGNKIVTTGGGGAVLTNDDELASRVRHLSTTAKVPHPWEYDHDQVGYNFRMPNINAAIGCGQLDGLAESLASKRRLHRKYNAALEGIGSVALVREPMEGSSNFWLQAIELSLDLASGREKIIETLQERGYAVRPVWRPLHSLTMYRNHPRSPLPVTERLGRALINLPSSAGLA